MDKRGSERGGAEIDKKRRYRSRIRKKGKKSGGGRAKERKKKREKGIIGY